MGTKRKEKPIEEGVTKKNNNADIFSSCSFSSLGLDSTLCDQLKGHFSISLFQLVVDKSIQIFMFCLSHKLHNNQLNM